MEEGQREGGTEKKGRMGLERRLREPVEGPKRIFVVIKSLRFLNARSCSETRTRGGGEQGGRSGEARRTKEKERAHGSLFSNGGRNEEEPGAAEKKGGTTIGQ